MSFNIASWVMDHMYRAHLEEQKRLDAHADAIKNGRNCDCWPCMKERVRLEEEAAYKKYLEEFNAKK